MTNIFGSEIKDVNIKPMVADVIKHNDRIDKETEANYGVRNKDSKRTSLAEKLSIELVENKNKYKD